MKASLLFNDLLEMTGINPSDVKLYRHKDQNKNYALGNPLYNVWIGNTKEFEEFQKSQSITNPFSRRYLASFVVTPSDETVFIGIYEVLDRIKKKHEEWGDYYCYDLKRTNHIEDLIGRIIINWDEVYTARQASPCAENFDFHIIKIKDSSEEPFPGFHDFSWNIDKINKMPKEWQEYLRKFRGVYLLTCAQTDKLYVGSASGEQGFLGRWQNYEKTDDGGNKLLIKHNKECKEGYQVSILEIASSSDTRDDILRKENSWKTKLLTHGSSFGLNAN